jgi:hypothetical protein
MKRIVLLAFVGAVLVACGDRDAGADGEEVVPVDMDTLSWFQQGQVVEHAGHRWVMVGPPVYDPLALTRVGDFQGTPLYAERGVASPPSRLYIPVGGGYWQMLERGEGVAPGESPPEVDVQPGTEGVEP